MDRQVIIGKIVAPHGVRGDLRILPLTEKPEQFLNLKYLLLEGGGKLRIENARFHKRMVLVKAEGVDDMSGAELLRGKSVMIYSEDLPPLEEGRFYVADLIGLTVFEESGSKVGCFKEVISTGGHDVYVIGVPEGRDILLPALRIFVREIDLAAGRIIVKLPEWIDEP